MNNTVKVDILGTQVLVPFPSVSQTMEIESMRHALTDNRYGEMIAGSNGVKSTMRTLDLVDAISTFTVLVPDLKNTLGGATINTIDMATGLKLVKAYSDQYLPFYNENMKAIDDELAKIGFNDANKTA